MIDPIHSLAFSMQANRGIYAVLLGSGVSRAANIPTGWEITLDLVRKLARLHDEECALGPEQWYVEKFGKAPDYSDLLNALAKTNAERQQLLRSYWEPNEQEREEGLKQPTAAHHAIAWLAAQGFIRLIVTTNFDRLMEYALEGAGVVPTVLSSPDHVQGALPLIHTRCCLLKIHGDYLDTRIRNTPAELAEYPPEFNTLLDRIFDEFGLVVCGWSADWDDALLSAIIRAPSRRFATYWAAHGEPSDKARQLIEHRDAQLVSINGADAFFQATQRYVESLEQFSRPHPLSTEAAVASLKKYLSEPKYRIQLADLVAEVVHRIVETTSGPAFAAQGDPVPDSQTMTARVRAYDAACSTLLAMAVSGGYWAEEEHYPVWRRALERLSTRNSNGCNGGYVLWLDLQRYPGTLLLYALGLGAVEAGKLDFFGKILSTIISSEYSKDNNAAQLLPPFCLFQDGTSTVRFLEGMNNKKLPMNSWIHSALKHVKNNILNENRYDLSFDRLEILISLSHAHHEKDSDYEYWIPPGLFFYRTENRERILREIEESITKHSNESPYIKSGIFGETFEECLKEFETFKEFVSTIRSRGW
jgi:hypothetical protein